MDIFSELYRRGMSEALELVLGNVPFQSRLKMHYVSKDWLQILRGEPYLALRHKHRSCPEYKKLCDRQGWTQYIMGTYDATADNAHRLKYIEYASAKFDHSGKL